MLVAECAACPSSLSSVSGTSCTNFWASSIAAFFRPAVQHTKYVTQAGWMVKYWSYSGMYWLYSWTLSSRHCPSGHKWWPEARVAARGQTSRHPRILQITLNSHFCTSNAVSSDTFALSAFVGCSFSFACCLDHFVSTGLGFFGFWLLLSFTLPHTSHELAVLPGVISSDLSSCSFCTVLSGSLSPALILLFLVPTEFSLSCFLFLSFLILQLPLGSRFAPSAVVFGVTLSNFPSCLFCTFFSGSLFPLSCLFSFWFYFVKLPHLVILNTVTFTGWIFVICLVVYFDFPSNISRYPVCHHTVVFITTFTVTLVIDVLVEGQLNKLLTLCSLHRS